MFADYTFYLNTFQGTATEAVFARLSPLATAHVVGLTFGRATTATGAQLEAVKMAFCAVIDELYKQEQGGIVTSESNDGISRSYATGTVVKSATQRIYSAAEVYLSNADLMYAGV